MAPYSAKPLLVTAPLFPERLQERMETTGVGIRRLALMSKVNKGTINDWRRGRGGAVNVEAVQKVAAVMGTSAEYLLDLPAVGISSPVVPKDASLTPVIDRVERLLEELAAAVAEARRAGVTR